MTADDFTRAKRAAIAIDRGRTSSSAPGAQAAFLESIAQSLVRIGDAMEAKAGRTPSPATDLRSYVDSIAATIASTAATTVQLDESVARWLGTDRPTVTIDEHTALRELAVVAPYARARWIRAAVDVARTGLPPSVIQAFASIFASGRLTPTGLVELAKSGIDVSLVTGADA